MDLSNLNLTTEQEFEIKKLELEFKTYSDEQKLEVFLSVLRLSFARTNYFVDVIKKGCQELDSLD